MKNDTTESPLCELPVRTKLNAEAVTALIEEMRQSLEGAHALGFYERMELNHDTRYCYWPGQTTDGRKWVTSARMVAGHPGQRPDQIFPWPGASDNRVPLIDEIINERVMFKRLALKRKQQRIGPRNMSPDEDPQQRAVLWNQTAEYYEDVSRENLRVAAAQVADIAEEYGHGVLYIGWQREEQAVRKEISADQFLQMIVQVAMQNAERIAREQGQPQQDNGSYLSPNEQNAVAQEAVERVTEMLQDKEQIDMLMKTLMQFDSQMPPSEARRVARNLKIGESIPYYATEARDERPEWRALTPFVDVFYPATTTRLAEAPWIAMTEWLTKAQLKERIDTEGYDEDWVDEVLKHKGRTFDFGSFAEMGSKFQWVLSHGTVRTDVRESRSGRQQDEEVFQIVHVYYRTTALGNVPALYHTILHGEVKDLVGSHECCEHAHGRYPFTEHLRDQAATYLLASRGVGEISFTSQMEVKTQRDMRADNASMTIKPPIKVPLNHGGGQVDLRPGMQIPTRSTAGMGMLEPLRLGSDARGSQEVEITTREAVDAYWQRGPKVDPDVKLAARQMLVSDFLDDMRCAALLTFQLIQEFAPAQIRAAFVGGLPVDMTVSREEIQGQVSLELDFDVADLDPGLVEKRMKAIAALQGMDREGLMQNGPLMKAMTAWLLPSHYRFLVADPRKQAQEEAADEKRIAGELLNGLEGEYQVGTNHALRLDVLKQIFGIEINAKGEVTNMRPMGKDGKPTRPQRVAMEDTDVAELVKNRVKFHAFQIAQYQDNALTGRVGVEPVTEAAQ